MRLWPRKAPEYHVVPVHDMAMARGQLNIARTWIDSGSPIEAADGLHRVLEYVLSRLGEDEPPVEVPK